MRLLVQARFLRLRCHNHCTQETLTHKSVTINTCAKVYAKNRAFLLRVNLTTTSERQAEKPARLLNKLNRTGRKHLCNIEQKGNYRWPAVGADHRFAHVFHTSCSSLPSSLTGYSPSSPSCMSSLPISLCFPPLSFCGDHVLGWNQVNFV